MIGVIMAIIQPKNENGINDQETCLCLPFNLTISKTKVQKIQILNITANVVFIIM